MQKQNLLHSIFFVIFFSIGILALTISILCKELLQYYEHHQILKRQLIITEKLKSLDRDYQALLKNIENDPNFAKRIVPATLGTEPDQPDTLFPKPTPQQLEAAKKALIKNSQRQEDREHVPLWIKRCCRPVRRTILFIAGSVLIIISFVCFRPIKPTLQDYS